MTPKEILQKVNDYCNEKSYTEETLTADFKNQFVENFIKGRENEDINDEKVTSDLKFNLKTAFSAASKGITLKSNSFTEKENDYKKQIEELQKKVKGDKDEKDSDIPEKYKKTLEELESYKKKEEYQKKRMSVAELAKKDIQDNFHGAFDKFFQKVEITTDGTVEEQAKKVQSDFSEMIKDLIGNKTPFKPSGENRDEQERQGLESVQKITIK